eukprot:2763321-Pyramimonas_sp.AAC.1
MALQSPTAATRSRTAQRIGGRGVARSSPFKLSPPQRGPQSAGGPVETSKAMGAPGRGLL